MHRNYLYLIILPLFLFLPKISYASGMEGLGIIILILILIIACCLLWGRTKPTV
jgi:hypothetical protein